MESCPTCLDLEKSVRYLLQKLQEIKTVASNAQCEDVAPGQCYSTKQILEIIEG